MTSSLLRESPTLEAHVSEFSEVESRDHPLMDSRFSLGLACAGLTLGGIFVWWHPRPEMLVDLLFAPLVAVLLHVLVRTWTSVRGAWAAVVLYGTLLTVTVLSWPSPGLMTRNLTCGGSAQLLVGLGALVLLEHLVLTPFTWSVVLLAASRFHPQFAFIPLLMMTLLRSRTLLVVGFVDKARGAALRCAGLCALALIVKRVIGMGPVRLDSVTLPLCWWIASWLLDGEALMPLPARVLVAFILSISTVAEFRSWPAMALVLLTAVAVSGRSTAKAHR